MPKINLNKLYFALLDGEKLPRKVKKAVLGKKINKSKLKKLIQSVKIIKSPSNIYEQYIVKPYLFCPNCGCRITIDIEHSVTYPDLWIDTHCARCKKIVGTIDNSPFIHVLEEYTHKHL